MRYLVLTVGTPACGKSTYIKNNELEGYTISPDNIRLMFQSPLLNVDGTLNISQKNDGQVWKLVHKLIEERMSRGELIGVDATNSSTKMINSYKKLVQKYRYRVIGIDFRDISLDTVLKQNKNRKPDYKFVPEDAIKRIDMRLKELKVPNWVELYPHTKPFKEIIKEKKLFDFSGYKKINVFGDIHGCYTQTKKLYDKLQEEGCFNIFVGDYFDRYPNEEEAINTLKWLNSLPKENNMFLMGNHEVGLVNHYTDFLKLVNTDNYNDFRHLVRSKQQRATMHLFTQQGLEREVKDFIKKMGQIATFFFGDKAYCINHGGLPIFPDITTPSNEFIKGVGKYEEVEDVCKSWSKNTPENYVQVFGHRDLTDLEDSLYKDTRCLIINGDCELGGNIKAVELFKDGAYNYYKMKSPYKITKKLTQQPICSKNPLEQFKKHSGCKVREVKPNLYSINFTSRVFMKGKYDQFTTLARGLYIKKLSQDNSKIVARGYHKFFNLNEKEETKLENLKNLNYPLKVLKKENGFLGILSVVDNEWHIATKATIEGDYVDMFKELLKEKEVLTDVLKHYIVNNNISITFEVVHKNDPHIIKYTENKLFLLDLIKNQDRFEIIESKSEVIKLTPKVDGHNPVAEIIDNYKELLEFLERTKNKETEGYVIRDNENFMFKIKLPYYSFWKYHRTTLIKFNKVKTRIKKGVDKNTINSMIKKIENRMYSNKDYEIFIAMKELVLKKEREYNSIIEFRVDFEKKSKI